MSEITVKRYRVALDCRLLHWPGVGRYCRELTTALVKQAEDIDFFWICLPAMQHHLPLASNVQVIVVQAQPFSLIEQIQLPLILRQHRIDLLHSPVAHNIPCWGTRLIVTMHDLILKRFPEFKPNPVVRAYYHLMNATAMRRAQRVICVSEFTRQDVSSAWPQFSNKLITIKNGVSKLFQPDHHKRKQFALPAQYLLYVGTLKRQKNIPNMLAAYGQLTAELRKRYPLVLIAQQDDRYPEVANTIKQYDLQEHLIWLPKIADEDMPAIYTAARGLILISLYEGFGLPVAEAMACGTPCVVSANSAMAEIGGNAVMTCDCNDTTSIANTLTRLLIDNHLHQQLSNLALIQSQLFSWQTAAQEISALYRQCMVNPAPQLRPPTSIRVGS